MPLGGYRGAGGTGSRAVKRKQQKQMSLSLHLKVERPDIVV